MSISDDSDSSGKQGSAVIPSDTERDTTVKLKSSKFLD